MAEARRSATLAIVGLPNSGKSTLLNALAGQKLAATSPTPQTTRTRILAVVEQGALQVAFLDTPGFHVPHHLVNQRMMAHVHEAMGAADFVLWVVDATGFLGPGERDLARQLKALGRPVYLLLNKLDLCSKGALMAKVVEYKDLLDFREIIPISAKAQTNLEPLWAVLARDAPIRAWAHDGDAFTDQTERRLAAEFIREKVLRKTREEVPHGVAVLVRRWVEAGGEDYPEDLPEDGVLIHADIVLENAHHRKIILGAQGQMIRDIRLSAQREIRRMLERPVRLDLHVSVEEGWRDNAAKLDRLET